MTVCITFDDGFMTHAIHAGPLLKERGWSGAFCVPTAFLDPGERRLSAAQVQDLCLEGNEDNLMTWDDVRKLQEDGHEVYPHTHDHVNLWDMQKQGRLDEVVRQVSLSRDAFVKHLGQRPLFFCPPHNRSSKQIVKIIRAAGMEQFNCERMNFGRCQSAGSVREFLLRRAKEGWRHTDISVHGIDAGCGGWDPFETVEDFKAFLDEIASLENSGVARVVPYSAAHPKPSWISPALMLWNRAFNRACVKATGVVRKALKT